jgi:hypothetical protein
MLDDRDLKNSKKGRMVSLVIAGSMVLWLLMQAVGPALGLAGRYALLVDFLALAALFWALVVTIQIWRARNQADANNKGSK